MTLLFADAFRGSQDDMIAWTNTKLKLTSGIGGLGTTALLAEISHQKLPIGPVIAMSGREQKGTAASSKGDW